MNLQTALIALGILLVAGIYLFSRWQEGRGGKADARTRKSWSEMSEPSLGRDEPSFDDRSAGDLNADLDADLGGARTIDMEEAAPPPDWDALEREMAKPREFDRESMPEEPPSDHKTRSASFPEETPNTAEPDTAVSDPDEHALPEPVAAGNPSPGQPGDAENGEAIGEDAAAPTDDDIPVLELRVDGSLSQADEQSDEPAAENTEKHSAASVDDDPPVGHPEPEGHPGDEPSTRRSGPRNAPVEHVDPEMPEDDGDLDMRDERPSLGSFLGSLKPINKLRHSIQNRLDAVKAERELSREDGVEEEAADSAVASGPKNSGQVDLLDLTRSSDEEVDNGDHEDPAMTTENTDTPVQSSAGGKSDAAERPRQAPSLGGGNPDADLHPAPGFDKLSQIDYYVKLSGERDVSRDSVLAVYREAAAGLSKSHSVYGLRLPDRVWRDLENEPEESRFGDLVITVQLTDNNGPVSEQEMTRFSNLVVKLSESTGRGFSFMAPIENAHQQALAIDRLRRKFDSIFVVNIKPTEDAYFDGAMIDRCALQIGLTPDENKFYARYKPVGKQKVCLYSMANMTDNGEFEIGNMRGTRTRGVTFFTRPAVNRSPGAVFSEMVDAAKAFASRVKGEPIAPGYDDLSNDDIEAIRRSIEKVAREMESYGIVPGSEEASRLF